MTELDVTLTDYGLAMECALFAYLLHRSNGQSCSLRLWFVTFFVSGSIAAVTGGTVHGFFHDPGAVGNALWIVTLLAIGGSALSAWLIGGHLIATPTTLRWITWGAAIATVTYALVVIFGSQLFVVAVVNYVPALLFLSGVFVVLYAREKSSEALTGFGSIILMFVAAAIQTGGVGLDVLHLDHNAFYHVVQGVAFAMFFRAALWCVAFPRNPNSSSDSASSLETSMCVPQD